MSEKIDKVLDFFVSRWYLKLLGWIVAIVLILVGAFMLKLGVGLLFNPLWYGNFMLILCALLLSVIGIAIDGIAIVSALSGALFIFLRIVYCAHIIKFTFEDIGTKLFKRKKQLD